MKSVLLVTNSYPDAESSETPFLEHEVGALLDYGHSIVLAPLHFPRTSTPGGPTPELGLAKQFRSWRLVLVFVRAIVSGFMWKELVLSARGRSLAKVTRIVREAVRARAMLRFLRRSKTDFDIIYTYWFTGETLGASFHSRATPVITRVHGFDLYEEREVNGGHIPFRRLAMSRVSRVIVLSNEAKEYLNQKYPESASKVTASPLGVTNSAGPVAPPEHDLIRIVSCSYPSANKRLDMVSDFVELVATRCPSRLVEWIHLGAEHADVAQSISEERHGNCTKSFRGKLTPEQVQDFYARTPVTLFINMSDSEGQPVSIMEAMSFGIPVVARAVGGIPEMVDERSGFLLSSGTPLERLVEDVIDALADSARFASMRNSALQRQRTHFEARGNHFRLARMLDGV